MYAVMRLVKLKTMGQVAALGRHNERTRETRNADEARRERNIRLVGSGDWCADVQARLDTLEKIRTNAVLAIEYVLTASKAFYADGDPLTLAAWTERSMAWLRDLYGPENVVAAVLHRDELTPHIQALVVPIDGRGRLNATAYVDGPAKMRAMQDGYARAVEDLGLIRGVRGSVASHQAVQEFYAKIEQPTPAPAIVRREVAVDRPGRIVTNPDKWASEQQERIAERIAPALDAALTKAQYYEHQAAKAEANIVVLQQRVQELERDYRALAALVRGTDLDEVMQALGGEQDRLDRHKWRISGEHISITGEKFYNHDQGRGGGGAIDLVMHVTGYDFKGAVAFLAHEASAALALAAAASHGARQGQEIVERGERPPFVPPQPDEQRWPQVRAYLTEQRALPCGIVDELHRQGALYADARANAVFLRTDEEGRATGASLRGTLPGSAYKGLAPGTRRDAGHFTHTMGEQRPHQKRVLVLGESPIDALSAAVLRYPEYCVTVAATDGIGALPTQLLDRALAEGCAVRCAFDNDRVGEALWQKVREGYPGGRDIVRERPPAGAKDWNEALRGQHEHELPGRGDGAPQRGGDRADRRR